MKRWTVEGEDAGEIHVRQSLKSFVLRMTLRATLLGILATASLIVAASGLGLIAGNVNQLVALGVLTVVVNGSIAIWVSGRAGRLILRLARSNARFERLSRTDELSGLLNRRAFGEALAQAVPGTSLAIIDVDRFKAINDTYGHSIGDDVIRRVADIIAGTPDAIAGRLGGEEFGVLLRQGTVERRIALVEELRDRIGAECFDADGKSFTVTISAGIAEVEHVRTIEASYAAADKALYLAKAGGRNRVVHDRHGLNLILDIVAQDHMQLDPEQTGLTRRA